MFQTCFLVAENASLLEKSIYWILVCILVFIKPSPSFELTDEKSFNLFTVRVTGFAIKEISVMPFGRRQLWQNGRCSIAARACLRSGVGFLTCHIPKCGYDIIQTAVPEAMV